MVSDTIFPTPLPVDEHVPRIVEVARERRAVVVRAEPGAGKTTRVPPALADAFGRVALLQPRRVAARSLARRIAHERGWTLGEEVGWHVRFERRFGPRTRLLVMTEGVLTARLASDPLALDFDVLVLDEFHERSLDADLALALGREALRARDDLRVVVMSATLDAAAVAAYLDDCPIVAVPGRAHPVTIEHDPHGTLAGAALRALASPRAGHVLCFLPGAGEIARAADELRGRTGETLVLPLHGRLGADELDRALAPSATRKLVLATNVAETSLTLDGVTHVVDTGLHKVARHDPARGLDRLVLERIPRDAADQRAGRAGRTGPGHAVRLWDARDVLRPHREPEVHRVDLAAALLDVLAWGGDPMSFPWLDPPAPERVAAAIDLLGRLGAVGPGHRLTPLGERLRAVPAHPRLARILIDCDGSRRAAAACALLADGRPWREPPVSTSSDVLAAADDFASAPAAVRRAAEDLARSVRPPRRGAPGPGEGGRDDHDDARLERALHDAYADRLARRREPGGDALLLASGSGARLGRESGVRDAELLVALDVASVAGREPVVRSASAVDPSWVAPTRESVEHALDAAAGLVRAERVAWAGAIALRRTPVPPDPWAAGALLADHVRARGLDAAGRALAARLRFAGLEADLLGLAAAACEGRVRLPEVDPVALLPREVAAALDRLAPTHLKVPSGRSLPLEYRDDGSVALEVKLQEMFGLAESPRLGPARVPVTLVLLSPAGRPTQVTRDLRGFWERTYPEVRRELRARYPKHPWPEDPWSAEPTARTRRRP